MGSVRRLAAAFIVVIGALALAGPAAAAPHPSASASSRPFVRGGQTVPAYSYAHAIHQSVAIQAPFDSDGDGRRDRLMLDIIRPAEADAAHLKVPVILDASPYYRCCGRGNESEIKTYRTDGTIAALPLFYDNYFVPRGYAVAALDLTGTNRSEGCSDMGGPNEIRGAKAAVDWLNGRARGFDLQGKPVTASWTNGAVGMIGKSWDGTIANGVAATGVAGLRTAVAISGISSWYDYTRFNGVDRFRQYFAGITNVVSGRPVAACRQQFAAGQRASDDGTGNFNAFWRARDYRVHAGRVRAAMLVVHGLNDRNVTTNQFAAWWDALAAHSVPRKIWLSQTGHVDPFDYRRPVWVRTLHQWFDRWLQGLDNGVMQKPRADVERASGHWITQRDWPLVRQSTNVSLARFGGSATRTLTDRPVLHEAAAVSAPAKHRVGRVVFLGPVRRTDQHIAGSAAVRLRLRANRPTTELTVRLVDYGRQRRVNYQTPGEGITTLRTQSCWGQSTAADNGCYLDTRQTFVTAAIDVLTRGWRDAAHRRSLTHSTPLRSGTWYSITVPVDATDTIVHAGHRLGVVVTLSDLDDSAPSKRGATVVIDPARSVVRLPTS